MNTLNSRQLNFFRHRPSALVTAMCIAQVTGMLGVFAFPALLPFFLKHWDLSNSQAGWINGIYFAGYTIAVPLLTSLTDRIDARKIYWISCGLGALANLGFALLSYGFWSALFFRAICGFGLAGTFIPGLKALIDRLDARYHPRAVSFYTACFGLGMSISFYFAGSIFNWLGWKPVFGLAAAGSFIALGIALIVLIPQHQDEDAGSPTLKSILNFKPVWENRLARQYIIAYMCHMWEMFAARSWMVAFLTFSLTLRQDQEPFLLPTSVMAVAGIGGMMASISGGELAVRFGRRRIVTLFMAVSFILASTIGFSAGLPYPAVALFCILYTLFFQGDSAAIHAGVISAAEPGRRGATMALQSLGGFASASFGSLAAGIVLDLSGNGLTVFSWGITFGFLGLSAISGSILLYRSKPNQASK